MKARYLEDMKGQTIAQKAAMDKIKTTFEKNKKLELEVQTEAHNKEIG